MAGLLKSSGTSVPYVVKKMPLRGSSVSVVYVHNLILDY